MKTFTVPTFLAVLVCFGLWACTGGTSGSGGAAGFSIDLTGTWSGTWTRSSGESGIFSAAFVQKGAVFGGGSPAAVTGSADLEDFACPAPLVVVASVSPGGFVDPPSFSGTFTDGSIEIRVFALIHKPFLSRVSGTYEVLAGSPCAGETGDFVLNRTVPLIVSPPTPLQRTVIIYKTGTTDVILQIVAPSPELE
ncbi:MAG: hypothetical protein ACI87O_002149 [Planctomycetota bacterium]|jgi:hypothetical protein